MKQRKSKATNVSYIPDRGDIVWIDFNPLLGHEQRGKRRALTLSPKRYNEKVGLALFCPITSAVKGYPFEVAVTSAAKVSGVILADQIKSLDWRSRHAKLAGRVPAKTIQEVISKARLLLD